MFGAFSVYDCLQHTIMSRFQVWSLILLIFAAQQIYCKSLKMSATLEGDINRLERQLSSDEQEFKRKTEELIEEADMATQLFADDASFKVLIDDLNNFSRELTRIRSIAEVTVTAMECIYSSDCNDVKGIIRTIERNVESYLNIIEATKSIKVDIFYAKEELSSEYFLNFMLMSDAQEKSIVQLTGNVEQYLKVIDFFVGNFQGNSLKIASNLFKLKVREDKRCPNIVEDEYYLQIVKTYKKSSSTVATRRDPKTVKTKTKN